MSIDSDITIISTGGTFNKIYNPISGELEVDKSAKAIKEISNKWHSNFKIFSIIGKDSLLIDSKDRDFLAKTIMKERSRKIIVVHGTDTIDDTALLLNKKIKNKQIVLTGAMVPFAFDEVEAVANLALAVGFLRGNSRDGVYIAMHSLVAPFEQIYKNRAKGKFMLS